ncbi:unnamed protein product [Polarella glacialis]|uniref:Fe2OG dioxygenase domain-containing protein n=1 Tax=Polarella glacialis TaxID=89957 RepID=A0A813HPQ4_POLGL|nr:unnamed protein product [Polarella glacialis]
MWSVLTPLPPVPPGYGLELDPFQADRTQVVKRRKFLSSAEIGEVSAAVSLLKERGASNYAAKDDTLYMQQLGFFQEVAPDIHRKISELVTHTDKAHWGLLASCDEEVGEGVNPRCIEFHEYGKHARNVCGSHTDTGSLITVDIMLSPTSEFEGGGFLTVATEDGSKERLQRHAFEQGDALVFVSHKRHMVEPVTSGARCVLVLEFWEGVACEGAHRCMDPECGTKRLEGAAAGGSGIPPPSPSEEELFGPKSPEPDMEA